MLRRDSELVVVPKFEIKEITDNNEGSTDVIADKSPKCIVIDFEI